MRGKLSATMTLREFENGYWYRKQLKDFAGRIGIPAAAKLTRRRCLSSCRAAQLIWSVSLTIHQQPSR